ncbi:hypothetical protein PAHAL_2G057600 [Panicum hallii]|uniref:Uncharacterized protein n=1 Tax=Panicum hallii TaxID=206008 RepID=A0A2T8KN26_9POAL|nr:hypothetical protein PAHAL_2G057600 [Panicum hallii]
MEGRDGLKGEPEDAGEAEHRGRRALALAPEAGRRGRGGARACGRARRGKGSRGRQAGCGGGPRPRGSSSSMSGRIWCHGHACRPSQLGAWTAAARGHRALELDAPAQPRQHPTRNLVHSTSGDCGGARDDPEQRMGALN